MNTALNQSFDHVVIVDWSGGIDRGPVPKRDAIWIGEDTQPPRYCRNRQEAEAVLSARIRLAQESGARLLIGFDFPFGYPQGVAAALGCDGPLALWDWLEARVEDAPKANNRFDLAAQINSLLTRGSASPMGPFWGNALRRDIPGLPRTKAGYDNPFAERRACELCAEGAFSVWQLAGAGSVGSQVLMGLPVLARLRRLGQVAVWPFEPTHEAPVVLAEIWPGLIEPVVKGAPDDIRDAAQVRLLAQGLRRLAPTRLGDMLAVRAPEASEEGWILGLGYEGELCAICR